MRPFSVSSRLFAGLVLLTAPACSERETSASAESSAEGARVFRACAVCHATAPRGTAAGDVRLVGPNLHGVVGRKAAALPDYQYTNALRASGLVWTEETLDAYIADPQGLVRGTRMSFVGEADAVKRRAIIAYLKSLE